jgi:hypothetical protein
MFTIFVKEETFLTFLYYTALPQLEANTHQFCRNTHFPGLCLHLAGTRGKSSVVDPKLFFSDPDSDPIFFRVLDPDPL